MTVPVDDRRREHPGNGVAFQFNGPMAYSADHIFAYWVDQVTQVAVPQVGYTVESIGRLSGTRVTMVSPTPVGQTLLLLRTVPFAQEVNITNQSAFNAEVLEKADDLTVMQVQQLNDNQIRALQWPETLLGSFDPNLPPWTPGAPLIMSATTPNRIEVGSFVGSGDLLLRGDLASSASLKGSTLVSFKQSGTGAIPRTSQDKLREFVSVKDFGAIGDGGLHPLSERFASLSEAQAVYPFATSLTQQIDWCAWQAALNASVKVMVNDGIYRLDATLVGQTGLHLWGSTPENCRIRRDTAYGDTLRVGVLGGATAGNIRIEGIFFWHLYQFNNGGYVPGVSTSLLNRNITGSHLNIVGGQNVRILDCWLEGNRQSITMTDSFNAWIDRCNFVGIWDANVGNLQDTESGVYCLASIPGTTRCDNINITNCRVGGYGPAAPTNVTTNGVTVSKTLNAGIRYGIRFKSAERFTIADNYIGGQAEHSILIEAHSIVSHGHIHDNMLDGSFNYSIMIRSIFGGQTPTFISIHNNTGVGYGFDLGFVCLQNSGGFDPAYQVHIKDNLAQYYRGTPIKIERGVGIQISGNTMSAYNSDGSTNIDPTFQSGCFVGQLAQLVHSHGNSWGGAINQPSGPNSCKWGIYWENMAASGASALERSLGLGLAGGSVVGGGSQTYPT